jgi:glutamyl-Q tRNA(Asp) synthetase
VNPGPNVVVTRFAPSPTGRLHLGHALAARFAHDEARRAGGRFLVRIEDIDFTRCRREHETAILEDLAWLGLAWDAPVRRQSEHLDEHAAALGRLRARELLYPCRCTRGDIRAEIARAGGAPQGPDGPLYPGLCRSRPRAEREAIVASGRPFAWRLDVEAAQALTRPLAWTDVDRGERPAEPARLGDVVLARKEAPTSYHLAVTVDDAIQGVTLVTRGEDLLESTHVHRLLQALLGFEPPLWRHHRLVTDAEGRRLAKRDGATTIASLRERGLSPSDVLELISKER